MLRRAGDLVFSNLVWALHREGEEFRTGRVHIDAADRPVKAQTNALYTSLSVALAKHGLRCEDVVHQRVHLKDMRDFGRWAQVMEDRFPTWRPATTVLGEGAGLPFGVEVAVEVVASSAGEAVPVFVPSIQAADDRFPAAVRSGGWVFSSGVLPTGRDGEVVTSLDDLRSRFGSRWEIPELAGLGVLGRRDERVAAQTLAIYANLAEVLEAAGSDMTRLVKKNGFTRFHLKEFTHVDSARRAYFPRVEDAPPATTVQVADLGSEDVLLQFDVVAGVAGGGDRVGFSATDETTPYGFYTPVVSYNGVAFTAGELAFSPSAGVPGSWESDAGRALLHQARFVIDRVLRLLEIAGAPHDGIARLNFYVRDRRFMDVLLRIADEALEGMPVAVVDTSVRDCGPYESCLFELDAVAEVRPQSLN